ncbi:MAG TPA: SIS domain-containing protein [Candidatus Lokiarchaeia archaeon]|nr:SIS domain-containing protein [Candidatus Lokiarchaeia archaeon]
MASSEKNELGQLTLAEIWEIPAALKRTLNFRDNMRDVAQGIIDKHPTDLILVGNGSSYHAGCASQYVFISLAKIPTIAVLAPEFPYLVEPIIHANMAIIAISQSGESEDSLQVCQVAKSAGALTIGITNNTESTLANTADLLITTNCGPEKSVLATKTYVSELGALFGLALELSFLAGSLSDEDYENYWKELNLTPDKIELLLTNLRSTIRKISRYFKFAEKAFVIGAGPDFATAQEAALKLKEGARVYAQAYSTSEFPHGPITLADPSSWIIAIIPHEQDERRENILKLLVRLKERQATILGISSQTTPTSELDFLDHIINLPTVPFIFYPIIAIIPIQLLTVEIAIIKNLDPDEPKYLSKVSHI